MYISCLITIVQALFSLESDGHVQIDPTYYYCYLTDLTIKLTTTISLLHSMAAMNSGMTPRRATRHRRARGRAPPTRRPTTRGENGAPPITSRRPITSTTPMLRRQVRPQHLRRRSEGRRLGSWNFKNLIYDPWHMFPQMTLYVAGPIPPPSNDSLQS